MLGVMKFNNIKVGACKASLAAGRKHPLYAQEAPTCAK